MKSIIAIIAIMCSSILFAQKIDTVSVTTSAQCEMCVERIESALKDVKGVKKIEHSDEEFVVFSVIYSPKKTNEGEIIAAINNAGYDANTSQANQSAYLELPKCCRKPE